MNYLHTWGYGKGVKARVIRYLLGLNMKSDIYSLKSVFLAVYKVYSPDTEVIKLFLCSYQVNTIVQQ